VIVQLPDTRWRGLAVTRTRMRRGCDTVPATVVVAKSPDDVLDLILRASAGDAAARLTMMAKVVSRRIPRNIR
jgi:hypothetical protein